MLRTLTKPRSNQIDALQKQIKWIEIIIALYINSSKSVYPLHLAHYILLINWTEQGISKIKESSDRYNSFKASLEKVGGN